MHWSFEHLILLHLTIGSLAITDYDNKQCEKLYQANQTGKFVSTGLLRTRLVLIDSDLLVYDLSPARLSARLYLNSTIAVPLQDKWPLLRRMSPFSHSVTIQMNSQSEHILVRSEVRQEGLYCWLYSISSNQTGEKLFRYDFEVEDADFVGHWISSNEERQFVVIDREGHLMRKYMFTSDSVRRIGPVMRLCKQSDTFQGDQQMVVQVANDSQSKCNYQVDWTLVSDTFSVGFTDQKWFYLFGKDAVYLFDSVVFTQPGTVVHLSKIKYEDFVVCQNDQSTTDFPRMNKVVSLSIILVLFVLIIGGLIVHAYIRQRGAFQDEPKTITKLLKSIDKTKTVKPKSKSNNPKAIKMDKSKNNS